MNNIKIDLKNARKEYKSKNYENVLEIYIELYRNFSNKFKKRDLISYYGNELRVYILTDNPFDSLDGFENLMEHLV